MKFLPILALFFLAACAEPSKVITTVTVAPMPPDLVVVAVKLKNPEPRATTPLAVEITAQMRDGQQWEASKAQIHPAAFVLNKGEEQILRSTVKRKGNAVRVVVTVKEQETGRVIKTEQVERNF